MAFGYKVKKVKFQNEYLIPALFEQIKDCQFTAGKPEMVRYMGSNIIVFPALDSYNQVQIMASTLRAKPTTNYVIQKGDELKLESAAKNLVFASASKGMSNLLRSVGTAQKECERLVDTTYAELSSMGL